MSAISCEVGRVGTLAQAAMLAGPPGLGLGDLDDNRGVGKYPLLRKPGDTGAPTHELCGGGGPGDVATGSKGFDKDRISTRLGIAMRRPDGTVAEDGAPGTLGILTTAGGFTQCTAGTELL
mmetsp:Transcript_4412/g.10742  ORF Transcript_4412/g.10742 Transcript_4412/m.10742 type:complete len:121 (-) Transcript_4412:3419-3781(-)